MAFAPLPHFVTGPFVARRVFLPDKEYGLALDALVKACSDILVLSADGERCLLGRRKVEPQPDWWFIGGRARPGDTTIAAAARNVKRELGLDLPLDRFKVLGTYGMVWQMRVQEPATNGTADVSTVHCIRLTTAEQSAVVLDEQEYDDSRFFPLAEVLAGVFHPALKQAVRDLDRQRALAALVTSCGAGAAGHDGDAAVAAAARRFVEAQLASAPSAAELHVRFDRASREYGRPEPGGDGGGT